MKNRILITGASGFVGKNFSAYFNDPANNVIIPFDRTYSDAQSFIEQFAQIDTVLHFAGKAHDLKKISDASEYYTVNTELTKRVYEAFLASNAKVFITLSSVKAVADKVIGRLTEAYPPDPQTDYGKSKLLAEQFIFSRPIPINKRVVILRPSMIYGPGNKGNLNLLYQIVKKGIPWPLGAFDNQRSFCSIENLNFALKEFIDRSELSSGIYNIADDDTVSTNRLIELISEGLGKKANIYKIPQPVMKSLARLGDYFHLPLNTERLQKLTDSYVVDNRKLVLALGKPLPILANEGLGRTIRSFRNIP